jgi:hypothetical protein
MCKIEPRLKELYETACLAQPHRDRWDYSQRWASIVREPMCRLVGWGAAEPRLSRREAYDIAYDTAESGVRQAVKPGYKVCVCSASFRLATAKV